jgi:cytochrome d ubiquinol oxidase subunit II
MDPIIITLGVILVIALAVYTLTGGADFGGGVWDLLARGPRAKDERKLIAHAIGPIWETNHVWLILVVVLLFVCFPRAFSALMTALHVPLTLMLLGVVLRGSAFVFRSYGGGDAQELQRWGQVFAISSVISPVLLGVCLGAASSGRITVGEGSLPAAPAAAHIGDFWGPWLAPFPWAVGAFNLALCTYLAAVYLVHEAEDDGLRAAFRRRALIAGVMTGAAALVAYLLAAQGAPLVYAGLTSQPWSAPLHAATAAAAFGALWALWRARDGWARVAAIAQVGLIVMGWGLSLFPYLVPPDLTLANSAASRAVLRPVLYALGAGSVALVPALIILFRVFKRRDVPTAPAPAPAPPPPT